MSDKPAADTSQLWTNSLHDTSAEAAAMTAQADEANRAMLGAGDDFARQQAADRAHFAATQAANFQHQAQQYQAQQFVVQQHNEPIQAQLHAQSEQQAGAMLTGALSFAASVATVGATATALGGISDNDPSTFAPPTGPASGFAQTIGAPSAAEPTSFAMNPTGMFNAFGWNATTAFGIAPSLGDVPSVAAYAAAANVTAPDATAPDEASPMAAVPLRRPNASMHMLPTMAPRPNMDFFERHKG